MLIKQPGYPSSKLSAGKAKDDSSEDIRRIMDKEIYP